MSPESNVDTHRLLIADVYGAAKLNDDCNGAVKLNENDVSGAVKLNENDVDGGVVNGLASFKVQGKDFFPVFNNETWLATSPGSHFQ